MYFRIKNLMLRGRDQFHGIHYSARKAASRAFTTAFIGRPLQADFDRMTSLIMNAHLEQIRRNFNPVHPMHQELPPSDQDGSYHPEAWRFFDDPPLPLKPNTTISDLAFLEEEAPEALEPTDEEGEVAEGIHQFDDEMDNSMYAKKAALALSEAAPSQAKFYTNLDHTIVALTPALMSGDYKNVLALYRELMSASKILNEYQRELAQKLFRRDVFLSSPTPIASDFQIAADNEPAMHLHKTKLRDDYLFVSETDYLTVETSIRRVHSSLKTALTFLLERHPIFHDAQFNDTVSPIDGLLAQGNAAIENRNLQEAMRCLADITKARSFSNEWLQEATLLLEHLHIDEEEPIIRDQALALLYERAQRLNTQRKAIDMLVSKTNVLKEELAETPKGARPRRPQQTQEPEIFQ